MSINNNERITRNESFTLPNTSSNNINHQFPPESNNQINDDLITYENNMDMLKNTIINNNQNPNSGFFLTDNIKSPKETSNEFTSAFFNKSKNSHPVCLNKLIINLDQRNPYSNSIDPLFFILNGEKEPSKEKLINYQTNPGIIKRAKDLNSNRFREEYDNKYFYMKEKEFLLSQLHNNIIFNKRHHNSNKTTSFGDIFDKCGEEKYKVKTDIKTLLYNNNRNYEGNIDAIKDLAKNEMVNRSKGRGIFMFNKNFQNDQRAKSMNNKINFMKEINEPGFLEINLKKTNFFERKKVDRSAQVFFARTFMKMTYEDYRKIKEQKHSENAKVTKYNQQYQKMYEKGKSKTTEQILNNLRDFSVRHAVKKSEYCDQLLEKKDK